MGFKDCIVENLEKAKVSPSQRDEILKKYDDAYTRALEDLEMSRVEAEIFAQDDVRMLLKNKEETSRNKALSLLKQKEVDKMLASWEGSVETKVSQLYQKAFARGEGVTGSAFSFFQEKVRELAPNFLETQRNHELFRQSLKQAFEGDFSGEAGKLARAIRDTNGYLRARFVNAGGVMGEIDNYTVPQVHSRESLQARIKEVQNSENLSAIDAQARVKAQWLQDVDQAFDLYDDVGRALDSAAKAKALDDTFEDILTEGMHSQKLAFERGEDLGMGRGDIDQRRNKRRVLHPKSWDAFEKYNNTYGVGERGLFDLFFNHVQSMSKDIGMLEVLGPRPTSMARHLDNKMRFEGKRHWQRSLVNNEFRVLKGIPRSGAVDSLAWKITTAMQNIMRSAMLGSASLSAISDTAFIATTAKIGGMNAARSLGLYTKKMFGSEELKEVAQRSGFISYVVNGSTLSDTRYAGEMAGDGATAWMAGLTNKLSGLGRMTEAAKDAISLEFMATTAEQLGKGLAFDDLNVDFRGILSKAGVDKSDWDLLKQVDLFDTGQGAKFLITSDLRASSKIDGARASSIAAKLDDVIYTLRQQASNEATLTTRAITGGAFLGDGSAGSLSKMFASSLFMFKTFPITVMTTHMVPAFKRAAREGRYDHIAMALIGTTLIGGGALQLKELAKGKTPKDYKESEFWVAAMLQGGGLGLFGDFVMGDYSRFGRNPLTEAGGPFMGLMSDIGRTFKGNFDRSVINSEGGADLSEFSVNIKRDIFKLIRRNTPLSSLWYTRLAMDRMLWDGVERILDPKYDKRMRDIEKRMRKNTGQEFYWSPRR